MADQSLFRYLYLKVVVSFIRLLVSMRRGPSSPHRCRAAVPHDQRREIGIKIPSRDEGRHILVDIYYPDTTTTNPTSSHGDNAKPLPVLVNWHGSDFIIPRHGNDAVFCARMAREVGIIVVDADYRKAPEAPFPAAVHDVEDALLWVASQDQRHQQQRLRLFDTKRIAVSGFSAGANLALVAATALRKKLADVDVDVAAVVAFYPLIDLAAAPETKVVPEPVKPIAPWAQRVFNDAYVPEPARRTDPAASPSFADPADFPDTVALLTAGGDVLRPEAQALAEKLRQAGGSRKIVDYVCEGVRHGFDSGGLLPGNLGYTRREESYTLVANLLREAYGL